MSMVNEQIAVCLDKVIEYRRWFHQHPELSGKEKETAAYIANALREMGLEPQEKVGGYGVVALIQGKAPGKCVGLRADFDALPIEETTGLPFASENPGVMHACGHDMHAAMLLGAAWVLNQMKDQFSGCVKLVFQPSEENNVASGAKAMIADGVLENPKVDAMIGQHMWPLSPTGTYLVRNGAMMASSDRLNITIRGKASRRCYRVPGDHCPADHCVPQRKPHGQRSHHHWRHPRRHPLQRYPRQGGDDRHLPQLQA